MTTPIDIARDYCRRGWAVLPVPHKSKAPRITGWTDLRLTEDELAAHFNGRPMNVGILLGEPSGGLVDVDLDHPAAVRLAGEYLPATDAIFGRVGNPSSHRLYRVRGEVRTTKHKLSTGAMLVELRATGCQTVAPGSTHPTGERIEWEPDGEPAEVEVNDLLQAVKALADAVRRELGEPVEVDKAKRTTTPKPTTTGTPDAYARTALRREAEAVAGAGAGGRNDALNKAAFALGTLVGAGLLHEQDAVSALTDAAATCGLTADDGEQAVRATIRSGIAAGKREPRQIPDHTTRAATMPGGDIATGDGDADLRERARLLTDVGNAARFALQHRDRLRWCGAWQCWLIWTGTRWARDEADAATKAAIQTAIGILSEAANATSDEQRQRIADHGAKSQRRERLSAMMALAHSDMSVTPADLDADGWLLNVTNGTLDLRTGELRPHDPADLITKLAPVEYDADADCPRWRSFIARTFAEDDGLIDYVQRWCGHCLTGDIREQVLPVAYGTGNNGKSKLLEAVAAVMGDYATTASADLFTETQVGGNEARYELAELHGARLVVASETERGRRLRVALIKTLTGDDTIRCRPIYGRPFTYRRTFKAVLITNHKPRVDDDTEAVWRRLRLVPFAVTIPKVERDTKLSEKLWAEAPGILAWLVRGCMAWQVDGLGEPDAVMDATSAYREESDPVSAFVADACTLTPDAWTLTADLRTAYERFCNEQGDHPVGSRRFTDAMTRAGCTPERRHAGRGWRGIGLLA